MKKYKTKLIFLINAIFLAPTLSFVAISCNTTNSETEKFTINYHETKTRHKKFFNNSNLNKLFETVIENRNTNRLLKSYDYIEKNILNISKKVTSFLNDAIKFFPDLKTDIERIITNIETTEKDLDKENKRLEFSDSLITFLDKNLNKLSKELLDDSSKEKLEELLLILNKYKLEFVLSKFLTMQESAKKLKEKYYQEGDEKINSFLIDLEKNIIIESKKTVSDSETGANFSNMLKEFLLIFQNAYPKIEESSPDGVGIVAIRSVFLHKIEFYFNDLSTNDNDAILISEPINNNTNKNPSVANAAILYIPNSENKLNSLNVDFQKIINDYQKSILDIDGKDIPEQEKNNFKDYWNFQIEYYKKLIENSKNRNDLTDNKLISSKINAFDLTGKYVLRITSNFAIQPNDGIDINYATISSIKINKETKKLEIQQAISNTLNKAIHLAYSIFSKPFGKLNESYVIDHYIPIDAKEFNETFLDGKTALEAAGDNSAIELNIKDILEFSLLIN